MFDALALDALRPPMPPEVPRIVEERLWLSSDAERLQRLMMQVADSYAASTDTWLKRVVALQNDYRDVSGQDLDAGVVKLLTAEIEEVETNTAWRAQWRARFEKRARRINKDRFKTDPALAAIERSFITRLLATDDRLIEALLDHALFLRAIRSEWDADARNGPVFDNVRDLGNHLRSLLG